MRSYCSGLRYASEQNLLTDYLYTGQQYDADLDLYSLRARYYDTAQGRFLSRDTYPYNYQNPFELNRYVYTANNPTTYVDPSGFKRGRSTSEYLTIISNVAAGAGVATQRFGHAVNNLLASPVRTLQHWWQSGYTTIVHWYTQYSLYMARQNPFYCAILDLAGFNITSFSMFGCGTDYVPDGISADLDADDDGIIDTFDPDSDDPTNPSWSPPGIGGGQMPDGVKAGEGGAYGDLVKRSEAGDKLQIHHMPQDAGNYLPKDDGGAIVLPDIEHRMTRTYGWRGVGTNNNETDYTFEERLVLDFIDVRNIAQQVHSDRTHYDKGLLQVVIHYRENTNLLSHNTYHLLINMLR